MDSFREVLGELKKPFPSADHKERKLPGGGKWFFIPWQRIRERLDEVQPEWAASYSDPVLCEGVVVVRCRLTICGVSREGVGNSETDKGYGTPVERATADAFKNAAEAFGVGAYLDDQTFVIKHLQSKGDGRGVKFGLIDKKERPPSAEPKSRFDSPQSRTTSVPQSADVSDANVRIKAIRTLTEHDGPAVIAKLSAYGVQLPTQLNPIQLDALVKDLCVEWAYKFMNPIRAHNSYTQHVSHLKQQGHSEIEAIKSWMEQVRLKAPSDEAQSAEVTPESVP